MAMATIKQIKKDLFTWLASEVKDETAFNEWLEGLFQLDLGAVLGVNLYIDLKNKSLDRARVAKVIDRMAASSDDARARFYACLEDEAFQLECILQHAHGPQPLPADRYVRIFPLDLGIEYYFRRALELNPANYETEDEVLKQFFNPDKAERKGLSMVHEVWRGRLLSVWVTSKAQLDDVRSAAGDERLFANAVRDRIGFSELDEGLLVGIAYPADFSERHGYIPTTLDAHAGCHFFIPYTSTDADWGLSCCLNANHDGHYFGTDGFKERVHRSIDGLTDEFEGEIIGEVIGTPAPDRSYLLEVALSRA
jgi:hypothetical protein